MSENLNTNAVRKSTERHKSYSERVKSYRKRMKSSKQGVNDYGKGKWIKN